MNAADSPSLDAVAGTGGARRRLWGMLIGCACLLGAGLLALHHWLGGEALSSGAGVHANSGTPPDDRDSARSPAANPIGSYVGLPTPSLATRFRQSLAERLNAIRAAPDETAQEELLDSFVTRIADADLAKALAFLECQQASELIQSLSVQLLRRWTAGSPLAAAAWVGAHSSGETRYDEIRTVAIVWADESLPEALAWVRNLPESAERNTGLVALAYEAARSAPMAAFQMARELPDGQSRTDLIRHTASQWADQNPQEAVAWASKVADETVRQQLLSGITTAWSANEPAAAARAAADLLPPGRAQDDAVVGIVQRWVQTEPAQAAAWAVKFPTGPLQDTAIDAMVKLWAEQEPAATGAWIYQLDEDRRDPAAAAYVGKIALSSPASAAEWAGVIHDQDLRSAMLETVAESWLTADPAAGRRWAAAAELNETKRAQLFESSHD